MNNPYMSQYEVFKITYMNNYLNEYNKKTPYIKFYTNKD